jgi:hypothetical protein
MPWLTTLFATDANGKYKNSVPDHYKCPTCTDDQLTGCDNVVGSLAQSDNCGTCTAAADLAASTCTKATPVWYVAGQGLTPRCVAESARPAWMDDGTFVYEVNGAASDLRSGTVAAAVVASALTAFFVF